jgi:hypothetical protein
LDDELVGLISLILSLYQEKGKAVQKMMSRQESRVLLSLLQQHILRNLKFVFARFFG